MIKVNRNWFFTAAMTWTQKVEGASSLGIEVMYEVSP